MKPIVVASHMRSGTHLCIDLLRRNVAAVASRYLNLDQLAPAHDEPLTAPAFERELTATDALPLLKTHTSSAAGLFQADSPECHLARQLLAEARMLYVARDGRDVLVSLYHYMRHYSERVRAQSFARFLRDRDDFFQCCPGFQGLDRVSAWARHVEGWLADPRAVVVRYEDLLQRFEPTLRDALAGLGLEAPARLAAVPVPAGLPRRVLRRLVAPLLPRRSSTAILPRRGVVGDATRYFSGEDERFFRHRAELVLDALGR